LVAGDEIEIESNGRTFIYKVQKVTLLDESAAFVDFSKTDQMLTLSTCNTFGQKQERWVVEAIFDREV
jgi:LPXTG-site transpeptidase (sortase) family protein